MPNPSIETVTIIDKAEPTLRVIAKIILFVGLLTSIICLFSICGGRDASYHYTQQSTLNPVGIAITISIALFSIMSWGLLNVVANISSKLSVIAAHFEGDEDDMPKAAEK